MSERWKPEYNGIYYYISESLTVEVDCNENTFTDKERIYCGNCFKAEEEAQAAAEKVKALLLSLHYNETSTANNETLPKLTAEVFDRPDCPGWAKYAAVDKDGRSFYYRNKPKMIETDRWCLFGGDYQHIGKFDASGWKNSLIERPAKLPNWCEVGEWVWSDGEYHKIIETGDDWIRTEWNDNTGIWGLNILHQFSQARLRTYNAEEMRELVGKVVTTSSGRHCTLVTACKQEYSVIEPQVMLDKWMYATDLLHGGNTIDGKPCGVFEHLENGEWVE
jgi:hypothetical protein